MGSTLRILICTYCDEVIHKDRIGIFFPKYV